MNSTQLEITRLIGDKTLSFGCRVKFQAWEYDEDIVLCDRHWIIEFCKQKKVYSKTELEQWIIYEILWHPATDTNFKKWMNEKGIDWWQSKTYLSTATYSIPYNSNLPLLEQSEETLEKILALIKNNGN